MPKWFAIVSSLVGLGLVVGFGYLGLESLRDYRAFPATPKDVQIAELGALTDVPRGAWVRLPAGTWVEEGRPVQPNQGGPYYLLLSDPEHTAHVIVAENELKPLDRAAGEWVGTPTVHRVNPSEASYPELPVALRLRGVDSEHLGATHVTIVWGYGGPDNALIGLAFCPLMVLVGLGVLLYAFRILFPGSAGADAVWLGGDLPTQVRLSPHAGRRLWYTALGLTVFGIAWSAAFVVPAFVGDKAGTVLTLGVGLAVSAVCFVFAGLVAVRARKVGGNEYFARLVWLPVTSSKSVRARGIDTGVVMYELSTPGITASGRVTAHSGGTSGGLVFRDASRSEVLAARPLHSSEVIVLSSDLSEILENPMAPLGHPRHRLQTLPQGH